MDKANDLEIVRAVPAVELRDADGDEYLATMSGHFSVFNSWYEVNSFWEGQFLERVAPGAFKKTIAEGRGAMKVLYDHGMDPSIGNKILGQIVDLREDEIGPYYEVALFATSYNRDLLPGLRVGAYGSSFRFQVIKDEWNHEPELSEHNPAGLPERTIRETRTLEFGPVTFPANPAATAGARSMTDEYYRRLRATDPDRIDSLLARAKELRTPRPVTTAAGAATQEPNEPASGHSGGLSPAQRRRRILPPNGQGTEK